MALTLSGSGITSANIVDNAITSSKIADGTIVNDDINASAGIDGSKVDGSFGKVLQVVQGTSTATQVVSSSSFVSTAISTSITPSSTSSKILVFVTVACDQTSGGGGEGIYFRLYKNGSYMSGAAGANVESRYGAFMGLAGFSGDHSGLTTVSQQYLDSPASTSSLTYTIYTRAYSSGYPGYINRSYNDINETYVPRGISTITLMEVSV